MNEKFSIEKILNDCEDLVKNYHMYNADEEMREYALAIKNFLLELQSYRSMKQETPYLIRDGKLYEVEADVWAMIGEPLN